MVLAGSDAYSSAITIMQLYLSEVIRGTLKEKKNSEQA